MKSGFGVLERCGTASGGDDHTLICITRGHCTLDAFAEFMKRVNDEANKFQGDMMSIEPIMIAESFDDAAVNFVQEYNDYEFPYGRDYLSVYTVGTPQLDR